MSEVAQLTRTYWVSLVAESAETLAVERDWWVVINARPTDTTSRARLKVLDFPRSTVEPGAAALLELEEVIEALGYVKASPWECKESGWVAWVELADDWWSALLSVGRDRDGTMSSEGGDR